MQNSTKQNIPGDWRPYLPEGAYRMDPFELMVVMQLFSHGIYINRPRTIDAAWGKRCGQYIYEPDPEDYREKYFNLRLKIEKLKEKYNGEKIHQEAGQPAKGRWINVPLHELFVRSGQER